MNRKLTLMASICIFFLCFTAWGNGKSDTTESMGVVNAIMEEDRAGKMRVLMDELEEANPGLEFNLEVVQFLQLDNKINLAHASNADYDFIQTNHSSLLQFYKANVLEPLDDYIAKSGLEIDTRYPESAVSLTKIDGNQYAIPWDPDCRVFAYNVKALEDAGVDPPASFDDLLPIARKIYEKNGTYAFGRRMKNPWDPTYEFGSFMLGFGAHVFEKDGDGYKVTCTSPEMIEYVEWSQEMWKYMPHDVNIEESYIEQMFVQNNIAFYIFGPWFFASPIIGENMEWDVDYKLMQIPGKVKSGSAMGGWMLGIGSGGKNKDGAWFLLDKVLEPQNLARTCAALPPDSRAYDYAPFNLDRYKIFDEQFKSAEITMPPVANVAKIAETYKRYFDKAQIGGMDAAAAMAEAQIAIQKLVDEN